MKCLFYIIYAYDIVCKQPEVIFHCSVYSFQFPAKYTVNLITWVYAMELCLEWKVEKNTSVRKDLIFVSFLAIVFLTDCLIAFICMDLLESGQYKNTQTSMRSGFPIHSITTVKSSKQRQCSQYD